jgi:hypothetical protein
MRSPRRSRRPARGAQRREASPPGTPLLWALGVKVLRARSPRISRRPARGAQRRGLYF